MTTYRCINCDNELVEVFEGSARHYQFRDALDIQIRLGYGQYRDQDQDQDGAPREAFCSTCSDVLASTFPGIVKMLDGKTNIEIDD